MPVFYSSNNTEFNTIAELQAINIQPKDNDLFQVVSDTGGLLYNYEPNSTVPPYEDTVLALDAFPGRFILVGRGGNSAIPSIDPKNEIILGSDNKLYHKQFENDQVEEEYFIVQKTATGYISNPIVIAPSDKVTFNLAEAIGDSVNGDFFFAPSTSSNRYLGLLDGISSKITDSPSSYAAISSFTLEKGQTKDFYCFVPNLTGFNGYATDNGNTTDNRGLAFKFSFRLNEDLTLSFIPPISGDGSDSTDRNIGIYRSTARWTDTNIEYYPNMALMNWDRIIANTVPFGDNSGKVNNFERVDSTLGVNLLTDVKRSGNPYWLPGPDGEERTITLKEDVFTAKVPEAVISGSYDTYDEMIADLANTSKNTLLKVGTDPDATLNGVYLTLGDPANTDSQTTVSIKLIDGDIPGATEEAKDVYSFTGTGATTPFTKVLLGTKDRLANGYVLSGITLLAKYQNRGSDGFWIDINAWRGDGNWDSNVRTINGTPTQDISAVISLSGNSSRRAPMRLVLQWTKKDKIIAI